MSAPPESRNTLTKLLPIRTHPRPPTSCWKTTYDDKIHVIFYYQLKKSRFKSKTQITPKLSVSKWSVVFVFSLLFMAESIKNGHPKKSFFYELHRKDAELSNEYWRLKELNASPKIEFRILKKCAPTRRKRACYLCLYEKLLITEYKGDNLLNQRNEFVSKYRHQNKFKLIILKTWITVNAKTLPNFLVDRHSIGRQPLLIFRRINYESAETVLSREVSSPGSRMKRLYYIPWLHCVLSCF